MDRIGRSPGKSPFGDTTRKRTPLGVLNINVMALPARKLSQKQSGSGSNGQSNNAGVPADCLTSSCKENVHSSSAEKKPCDSSPKLSENVSDTVSSEDLETVAQAQDSSKFKSVDSNLSLPDLLLPEAVYKKQSDTDTDTADYESAADTYESATETDISEAVTPSEKYGGKVSDEVAIVYERPGSTLIDDSEDETSAGNAAKNITCEGANCTHEQCSCNAGRSDLTHPQDSPIVSDDKELAQLVAKTPKSQDLSLCAAFSQLCLSSPANRSSSKGEIDYDGNSWTENNENTNILLDIVRPASPCILDETFDVIPSVQIEDSTLLKHKLDNNRDLSLLNFGQEEGSINTTDIGDVEHTLAQKFLPGETDVNNLADETDNVCLLYKRDELAEQVSSQPFDVGDVSEPSLLIDEKVEVPKEEKTEVININFLDERTLCKSTSAEDKTEESNIPSKELPPSYLSSHDVEPVLLGNLTDPLPTPAVEKCSGIQEGNTLDLGHKDSDLASCPNITEQATDCIVENPHDKHLSEKNEVCDLDVSEGTPATKSETVQEVCKFVRNRSECTTEVSTCRSLPPNTQSLESGNFEKERLLSQDRVLLVETLKSDGFQSNDEQLSSDTCQTQDDLPGDNSFIESSAVDDGHLEIRPKTLVLDIKEEEFGDARKLNQLIEICNRQQEDLNQTIAEFVQDTPTSQLFSIVPNSCDTLTTTSTDPAECATAIVSHPLIQEETSCNIAHNDNLEFEDIALEASKVAESILHSSEDTDLDSESDTLSSIPLKMADSEEFTIPCTGSPMQSKTSVQHNSSCDVHSCYGTPKGSSTALSSSDLAAYKEKDINQKSAHSEVNQSEAGPDIADEVSCKAEDVFKDASAFDFLSAIGSTQAAQDLRKQSLYVKFDPLVESMSQTEKNKVSSPSSEPCREQISSVAATGGSKALQLVEKLISVTPTPKKRDQEVMNRRSASSVPKELFPVKKEEMVEVSQPEQQSVETRETENEEVLHHREELERLKQQMMEEAAVLEQEKEELRNKLRDAEMARRQAEESERRKDRLLNEKSQSLSQMSIILEEYEKTISRLVAEKEHEKQAQSIEVARLTKEKDTMSTHLENIEIAFSDVHQKYEKSKQVIQGFVKNEEALRASLAEYESTIKKQEQKYDALKSHAMAQLEGANEELNMLHRNHQVELTKLRAMLKKAELKVTSLEEVVEQKTKENQELVTICDELIGNVETK
ncbi:uro-adherence factor A isoform X2 [Anabrus simplex]|uniref:uro-adherence factor A isoform X2 n=1 Tax=Anabrus simplex TaxID=316456 RepID=UPI0035A2FBFE